MHQNRDQVLTELICRAAQSRGTPHNLTGIDLAGIDGCWELRRFLARVAAESCEDDWEAKSARNIIGRARRELAANDLLSLPPALEWPESNKEIRREVMARLDPPSAPSALEVWTLAKALVRLYPDEAETSRVRACVLNLLDAAGPLDALPLADALVRLDPKPPATDIKRARGRVLYLLDHATAQPWEADALVDALVTLGKDPTDMARARARVLELFDARHAHELADTLGKLGLDPLADLRGWTSDLVNAWFAPPAPPDDPRRAWATPAAPLLLTA